jgi:hypothetical protein
MTRYDESLIALNEDLIGRRLEREIHNSTMIVYPDVGQTTHHEANHSCRDLVAFLNRTL